MTSNLTSINAISGQMTGATSTIAGGNGGVPAPAAGNQTSFLRGDGTWASATTVSTGTPEAVVTGNPGDTYWDTTADILYIKETGVNTNTGWTQGPPATNIQASYFDIGTIRVQWGKTASVGDSDQTITFPFSFAAAPTVTCSTELTTGTNAAYGTGLKTITTTDFLANRDDSISDADGPFFNWIAIGLKP